MSVPTLTGDHSIAVNPDNDLHYNPCLQICLPGHRSRRAFVQANAVEQY